MSSVLESKTKKNYEKKNYLIFELKKKSVRVTDNFREEFGLDQHINVVHTSIKLSCVKVPRHLSMVWVFISQFVIIVHVILSPFGGVVVVIVWQLNLQLPMQSVPITTKVVSSNPAHGEMYSIQPPKMVTNMSQGEITQIL